MVAVRHDRRRQQHAHRQHRCHGGDDSLHADDHGHGTGNRHGRHRRRLLDTATPSNCSGTVAYAWHFGDGTANATIQNPTHTYSAAGTYSWTFSATVAGVSSTKTGSIAVSATSSAAPVITSVRRLSEPFRLQINGDNFAVGVQVFIGADTSPWPAVSRVSQQRLVLSGSTLSSRFPRGVRVTIRVVNPDGRSATTSYTRH